MKQRKALIEKKKKQQNESINVLAKQIEFKDELSRTDKEQQIIRDSEILLQLQEGLEKEKREKDEEKFRNRMNLKEAYKTEKELNDLGKQKRFSNFYYKS